LERVRAVLEQSPRRSAWRHARTLQMSRRSLGRLLVDLKFHPYKMQMAQELREIDKVNRRTAWANILARMEQEPMLLHQLLMSDEANFFPSGFDNKQNVRYWSRENPRILHEKPQKGQKVGVWCAVGMCGITGPYFFEWCQSCTNCECRLLCWHVAKFPCARIARTTVGHHLVPTRRCYDTLHAQVWLSSEICFPIVWSPASAIWLGHLAPQI
jgi:hypothetical protein